MGVILTIAVIFLFFNPNKEVNQSQLEEDVRKIYGGLVELGYTQDVSDDDIKLIIEKVQEASNWVPNGNITASDVLEGKTFINDSREIKTGTYVSNDFVFLGNALENEVLEGKQFYSNAKELLTGTLRLPSSTLVSYRGNASVNDVLAGKTFYSNSGILKTGTFSFPSISYLGDALETDVMSGKKFYSNSGILNTGTYVPPSVSYLGDASVDEVIEGKKFYSDSGTLLTGTYTPLPSVDFTNMQYSTYDDYAGGDYLSEYFELGGAELEDYEGEESEWTKISDDVWKDTRTGVYWSSDQTNDILGQSIVPSNNFDMSTCDFFTSLPRGSYDGTDNTCGNAINWCANLELDGRSNWYLPSQKELLQALIDGIYNQAGDTPQAAAAFASGDAIGRHDGYFFSSSEVSHNSSRAWYVAFGDQYLYHYNKTDDYTGVRCVSRDYSLAF